MDGDQNGEHVIKTLKRALQPVISDVSVSWELEKGWTVQQIPSSLPQLFSGDRLVVFGLLKPSHGNTAGEATVAGKEVKAQARLRGSLGQKGAAIDHVINFAATLAKDHDQALHGTLHCLYAKCLIQEKQDEYHDTSRHWNNGEQESMKDSVISVSKAANVVSKFTSFVAIDKDSHQPVSGPLKNPMFCYGAQDALYETDSSSDDDMGFSLYDAVDEDLAMNADFGSVEDEEMYYDSPVLKGACALPTRRKEKGGFGFTSPQKKTTSSPKKATPKAFFSSLFGSSAAKASVVESAVPRAKEEELPDRAKGFKGDLAKSSCPPSVPDRVSQKKKESAAAMSVISLQKASGSWELTDQLVSLCGTSRDALIKGCPKEIASDTGEGKLLWATALALVLLMGKFLDQKDEWEMIAEKGTKWMKKNLPAGVKYENVLKAKKRERETRVSAATTIAVKIY
ncbi:hypothetical protein ACROYT_G042461 [Oculina patagonica]